VRRHRSGRHSPHLDQPRVARGNLDGELAVLDHHDRPLGEVPERGALGTRLAAALADGDVELIASFAVERLARDGDRIAVDARTGGRPVKLSVERIVASTGFRPDLDLLREVRVALDPALECPSALAPLIDPNLHSCGTVRPHGAAVLAHPDKDFYIAGMKSYGRAPTFLLATGHEQVRSIAAALAGDMAASARVELDLPETGVCSVGVREETEVAIAATAGGGCCGGPAPAASGSCCVADVEAKAVGKTGCGCS
jgi:hypothetical protein